MRQAANPESPVRRTPLEPADYDTAERLNHEDHSRPAEIARKAVLCGVFLHQTTSIISPQEFFDLTEGIHDSPVCNGRRLIFLFQRHESHPEPLQDREANSAFLVCAEEWVSHPTEASRWKTAPLVPESPSRTYSPIPEEHRCQIDHGEEEKPGTCQLQRMTNYLGVEVVDRRERWQEYNRCGNQPSFPVIAVDKFLPSHSCTFASHGLTGQCESIFAMIRSARAIASEIAYSDAGEFLPSRCDNFRAARMQAAMRITRYLPSSMKMSLAYSPFIRHTRICRDISNFGICTVEANRAVLGWVHEGAKFPKNRLILQ